MSEPDRNERHLLVVDDTSADIELVRESLGTRPIRVHAATSVEHAIRFLERCDGSGFAPLPGLVILDLHLPIHRGTVLLEERRRRPAWKDLPIVMYSSSDEERDACLRLGATEFVLKPATWDEWERMMDRLLATYLG